MSRIPLSLTSGLVFLIVQAAVGVDTTHRISSVEKHHDASTRIVLGIDSKGVTSYAGAKNHPPLPDGEFVAGTVPEGRVVEREAAEKGADDLATQPSSPELLESTLDTATAEKTSPPSDGEVVAGTVLGSHVVEREDAKKGADDAVTQPSSPELLESKPDADAEAVAGAIAERRDVDRKESEHGSDDVATPSSSSELPEYKPDATAEDSPNTLSKQEGDLHQTQIANPSSAQPKGMMRRETKRKPVQVMNSSDPQDLSQVMNSPDPQDLSTSLLQVETQPGLCMTEVKSAALDVGNFASFKLNGRTVNPPTGRGFNILVVTEDWTEQEEFKVFDTAGRRGDNQEMNDFLAGLRDGACILAAVKDDAAMQITSQPKLALEDYGAAHSFDIAYRSSYAMIGCKGQPTIKESAVERDQGSTPWLCPERCEWSEWGEWEECSATCGGGEERRTREKAQEGEPGGWPCEGEADETRECGMNNCTTTTTTATPTTAPLMPILKAGAPRMHLSSFFAPAVLAVAALTLQRP